jgi:hypothetical protein
VKAHEAVNTSNAFSVNPAIAGAACHLDIYKPGLAQNALNQTLKTLGLKFLSKNRGELVFPSFLI